MNARSLKSLFAIASTAAILLAGCDSLPGRPTQADFPQRPSDVTDFAALYGENCAGCHGADGKSGAALAMNNPVYLAIVDDASMRRVIADGVAGTPMPPFAKSAGGSLTDPQIDILIAGIRKNWAGAPDAGTGAPPYSGFGGQSEQWLTGLCGELSVVPWRGRQGRSQGRIDRRSFLSLTRQRPKSPHDRNRRASRARPSRLEERRRRATVDARAGLRRGRMAGLETSRLTAGPE